MGTNIWPASSASLEHFIGLTKPSEFTTNNECAALAEDFYAASLRPSFTVKAAIFRLDFSAVG